MLGTWSPVRTPTEQCGFFQVLKQVCPQHPQSQKALVIISFYIGQKSQRRTNSLRGTSVGALACSRTWPQRERAPAYGTPGTPSVMVSTDHCLFSAAAQQMGSVCPGHTWRLITTHLAASLCLAPGSGILAKALVWGTHLCTSCLWPEGWNTLRDLIWVS